MKEVLFSLIAEYGAQALVWVTTALMGLLATHVFVKIKGDGAKGLVTRATGTVFEVVTEVWQTYVAGIKKGREDGKLTPEEAAEARKRAWEAFKDNLGAKGLKRLLKVLGVDEAGLEKWFGTKREVAVAEVKRLMNGHNKAAGPLA